MPLSSDSILVSQFSYKRFDADVTANSTAPYQLLVETTAGGFFDQPASPDLSHGVAGDATNSAHMVSSARTSSRSEPILRTAITTAVFNCLPVTIIGTSDLPIERILFGPAVAF